MILDHIANRRWYYGLGEDFRRALDFFAQIGSTPFEKANIPLSDVTFDLHNSVYEADNIHTEYEDTFSAKGFAINRLVGTIDKSLQPLETAEADADETDKTDEAEPADGNSEA